MGKRLFFVLSLLFVFSLFFVQVLEAEVTNTLTITKIAFYTSGEITPIPDGADYSIEGDDPTPDPQTQYVVELPASQTVRIEGGGSANPNISDFVYQGNIPNGTFTHIGLFISSSTIPGFTGWRSWGFDYEGHDHPAVEKIFNESDRKLITIHMKNEYSNATVENL